METLVIGGNPNNAPFRGYNAGIPERLAPGEFSVADNVIWDDGTLRTRPGLRAMLTVAGGRIGKGITFQAWDGLRYAIYVAGGDTTAGIYLWEEGAAAATLVSGGTLFTRNAVQMTICGNYIFISGAVNGELHRYSYRPAFVFESAAGLAKPDYTLTATTGNTQFAVMTTAADWEADSPSADMTVPDDHFQSGDAPGAGASPWDSLGGIQDLHNGDPNFLGFNYLRIDTPDQAIQLHTPIAVPVKINTQYTGAAITARHSIRFIFRMNIKCDRSLETVLVALIGYDALGNIAGQTDFVEFTSRYPGAGADGQLDSIVHEFSFANQVDDNVIVSVAIKITGGPRNTGGAFGPYISFLQLSPADAKVSFFTDASLGTTPFLGISARQSITSSGIVSDVLDYLPLGRERLSLALGAPTDFDNLSNIAFPYREFVPFPTFPLKLGLRVGTAGLPVYTDTLERYDAIDGKYLVADLSVIPAADRVGITHLELYFSSDVGMPPGHTNSEAGFAIGNLMNAGRLTPDLTYAYRAREYNLVGGETIASPATPLSGTILPSRVKAQGVVVIGAGTLPANTAALMEIYREGGTEEDGIDRLVAQFVTGADIPATANDGLWSWDDANRTFTDNTPDLLMIGASILEDHDVTPLNAACLATFAGRLVLSVGDTLYLSRASAGRAVGLYWTYVYDKDSPSAASSGETKQVDGEGGDIVALANHVTRLIVFLPNSPYVLLGDRPSFSLRQYQTENFYGAVSFRSVYVQVKEVLYLSGDGLRSERFDDSPPTLLSRDIEKVLNPLASLSGTGLDPNAYALAFVAGQAGRIFLSAPLPGETDISVLYVYDRRPPGGIWTRWLTAPLSDCWRFAHGDKLYFAGSDGQIYRLGSEWGDTATRDADPTPVTITVKSRAFTVWSNELNSQRFCLDVDCADAAPVYTWQMTANKSVARQWTKSFAPGSGRRQISEEKVASQVRGAGTTMQLSIASMEPTALYHWELQTTVGKKI